MKIKIICAAIAAVIAVSTAVVAAAYGNSEQNETDTPDVSTEQSAKAEDDEYLYAYDDAGNKYPLNGNEIPGIIRDKDGNIKYQTPIPEQSADVVKNEETPVTAPIEDDDLEPAESVSVNAVSAIKSGMNFTGEFGKNVMPKITYDDNSDYKIKEDSEIIGFLQEFFGCNELPVDDIYKDNIKYNKGTGCIEFNLEKGAIARSPVDGKVIGVCGNKQYNHGLGNFIAVEFGDKIFMMTHLDSVSVKVGDEVTAGQTVGVCGDSGMVEYGKTQMHFFPMIKR